MTVLALQNIVVTPSELSQELCPDATATQQITICNTGELPLVWNMTELSSTLRYVGKDVTVHAPPTKARPNAASRSEPKDFPARDLTVHVGWVSMADIDVLIVTPDVVGGGDISLLLNTLAAFPDLVVTVWDGHVGTPTVADMQGYDVVFVGNDILWTSSAIDKIALSDNLADYIDAGGKVLAGSFIWSYDDWGMAGGRFLTDDYSPFEMATTDYWDPISLGTFDAGHPIMAGITNVTEGYNHQDPALSPNGTWVASWADSTNFVAVAPNSVGLNALYFNAAVFGGQAAELLHNALVYLGGAPAVDIPWLSEDPTSGTVPPGECVDVAVTFDSTGMAPGIYNGNLVITSNDPDTPEVTIPVQMTVLAPPTGANFTWVPTTPWVGEMIDFTGSVAAGALPLTWHWNFDDGTTAGGQSVLHAFATPGDHLVTLTVTNGCGQMVVEHMVTVRSYYNYYYLPIVFRNYAPEK